ncbi:MAG: glycosyltransferase family 4 protein [Leptolyngbya sp. BL-A-14]
MRVAVVSGFLPSKHNLKGPTALPYQLLKYAPNNVEIDLYYFPLWYEVETPESVLMEDLHSLPLKNIYTVTRPNHFVQNYVNWRNRRQGLPGGLNLFPVNQTIVNKINLSKPELVWLYPHWLVNWIDHINSHKIVVSGMDSSVLHTERLIRYGKWQTADEVSWAVHALRENTKLEAMLGLKPVKVHMVGINDVKKYAFVSGQVEQAFYSPHPHYDYLSIKSTLTRSEKKVTVLFSGGGDNVYVGNHLKHVINSLVDAAEILSSRFNFLFIGSNYKQYVDSLLSVGYSVDFINWVDDYSKALSEALIQIFPIAVGSGTKGKVLQAFASGLLAIGSDIAFENISVIPGKDCLQYHNPEDVSSLLIKVLNDLPFYEKMAASGAQKVREKHAPEYTSKIFWEKILQD